jgi:hypothetical protein
LIWLLIFLAYGSTWVGGWVSHARNLKASAQARYDAAQRRNAEILGHVPPGTEVPIYAELIDLCKT